MKRRDLLKLIVICGGIPFSSCDESGDNPNSEPEELPNCQSQDTTKLILESYSSINPPKLVLIERTTSPLLKADKPWESNGITYSNVLKIDGKWKMWYSALDENSDSDYKVNLCYAESPDGISWTKPNLNKTKYNNKYNNNIVIYGGVHGATVFYDANAPLGSKYKIVFTKYNEVDGSWIYGMSSENGIDFTNPVLLSKTNSDTQITAFFDKDRYRFYLRHWDGGQILAGRRTIAYSESSAFGIQCLPTPIEILSYGQAYSKDLYNNGVSKLKDNLYVMFPSIFEHSSDLITPYLATGENGMNFSLEVEKEFLPLGTGFDSSAIYVSPGCVQGDSPDEFIFYYSGRSLKHSTSFSQLKNTYNGGIGRFIVKVN